MLRRSKTSDLPGPRPGFSASRLLIALAALSLFVAAHNPTPPSALAQAQPQTDDDFRLRVETDLVVLHATITDKDSKPVADLKQDDFKVFENGAEQKIKIFKREDIPVSVGILVDNSGSMRDKRRGVNAAALKFVQSSNERDEVFIVNFNEESFLDADFTDSIPLLEEALEKIDARGGTALYDAIDMSLEHMKDRATLDKKVLIAITDGEDNASRVSLEQIVQSVEHSNVMIYTVGLLSGQNGRSDRRAKRALQEVSKASGGAVFFPENPDDVLYVASEIANDIRNQYVIAYTPANLKKDGTFRKVEIKVNNTRRGKLNVRTRTGYYAEAIPRESTDTTDSTG